MGSCCARGQEVSADVTNTPERLTNVEAKDEELVINSFPDITTVDALETALQQAVLLELSTIPIYLSGYWSINERTGSGPNAPIADIIQSVYMEEMTHMALASNLYNCFQANPKPIIAKSKLNMTTLAPVFSPLSDGTTQKTPLPGGALPDLKVTTGYITKDVVLNTYMAIEQPAVTISPTNNGTYELDKHNKLYFTIGKKITKDYTIGDFYQKILDGFTDLNNQNKITFPENNINQFSNIPGMGKVTQIHSLTEATSAINLIVSEGEGVPGYPPEIYYSPHNLAHFYKFLEVYVNRKLLDIKKVSETNDDADYEYVFDDKDIVQGFWTNVTTNVNQYKFVYPLPTPTSTFQTTYSSMLNNLQQYQIDAAINDMMGLQSAFIDSTKNEANPFVYTS